MTWHQRASQKDRLRAQIETDIVTGLYAPGTRLDEAVLAQRFNVSRTPVREALAQLAAMDLITLQPHRGAFVNVLGPADMVGMFEVMAELEGMCARLAARRAQAAHLEALETRQTACRQALAGGDSDGYYYANEQFHAVLYAASGNACLQRMAAQLHTRLSPYRRLQLRVGGRMQSSAHEHDAIIAAIRRHDAGAAETLTKAHIAVQGDRFCDFLANLAPVALPRAKARFSATGGEDDS